MTYTATVSGTFEVAGAPVNASYSWTFTTAPVTAATLFSPSSVPANPSRSDSSSINVGVLFSSKVAGYISGIRFYKGSGNTGTHVGYLWSSSGTLLASATFTNETASGWQQVNFSAPVAIAANTTYVASYLAPYGHYAEDWYTFAATGVNSGVLQAPSAPLSGGNGVYVYSYTGAFPSVPTSSNYWVDVVFDSGLVTSTTPPSGATTVSGNTREITATLNPTVESDTLSFEISSAGGTTLPATFAYDSATNVATLTPSSGLTLLTTYTVTVSATFDVAGSATGASYSWSFTTAASANVPVIVVPATPVITWADPASIVYGNRLGASQLDARANVAGTFIYTPAAGTVLHAGDDQMVSVRFIPTDTTDYTAASASILINVLRATPAVNWPDPANIAYGVQLGSAQLDATASVPGTFVYSPAAGTFLRGRSAGAVGQFRPRIQPITPPRARNQQLTCSQRYR